jgi:hypothetical protein
MVFDDRRRGVRLTGDRDTFIASSRLIVSSGLRLSRTLLATAGDRLALQHLRWWGSADGAAIESENLSVLEVDGDGRIVAIVAFDPDDRGAAGAELFERHVRGDPGPRMSARAVELVRAARDHDLARARAALPDDFVFHDHRRTGVGRIETADACVAWLAALYEQAPDAIVENLYDVVTEAHGSVGVGRTFGTLAGGGPFESFFVRLMLYQGERFVGAELFELGELDLARARLDALRPDPTDIPPNGATRAREH